MRVLLAILLVGTSAVAADYCQAQEQPTVATSNGAMDAQQAQRRADWAKVRAARMQPLSVPQGENPGAWRRYTVELAGRLSDDGDSVGYWQLTMLADSASTDTDAIRTKFREIAEPGFGTPERVLLAASDSRRLAKVIAAALRDVPAGALQGDTLVFVGAPADGALLEVPFKRVGATLRVVDASVPYPGKVEPEAVPGWFDGPRY